jgi:hypothetical protein
MNIVCPPKDSRYPSRGEVTGRTGINMLTKYVTQKQTMIISETSAHTSAN